MVRVALSGDKDWTREITVLDGCEPERAASLEKYDWAVPNGKMFAARA
jgi:hypothetical protein